MEFAKSNAEKSQFKSYTIAAFSPSFFLCTRKRLPRKTGRKEQPASGRQTPCRPTSVIPSRCPSRGRICSRSRCDVKWAQMPDSARAENAGLDAGQLPGPRIRRHVQDFAVKDAAGRALAWRKINKNTWQVDTKGAKEIVATYRVYANELTVRTNELNDEHAFWNNAASAVVPERTS